MKAVSLNTVRHFSSASVHVLIHHQDNSIETTPFIYTPLRQLCSSSNNCILCVPSIKTKKTFGQRSFSYAGPVIWNKLPFDIRTSLHSQKPRSSKPSKPICLARTTSLKIFILFATRLAGRVSLLGYIFCAPPSLHSPIFVTFDHCCWLLCCCWLPSRALLLVVIVLFYSVLLWSALNPNEMGSSRNLYYYY